MKSPKTIKFSDLEIKPIDLDSHHTRTGIIPQSWTRVQFTLPSDWQSIEKVSKWLADNSSDDWASYNYSLDTKNERVMVVKFKDKNDALMFKLRGGHQCWQQDT